MKRIVTNIAVVALAAGSISAGNFYEEMEQFRTKEKQIYENWNKKLWEQVGNAETYKLDDWFFGETLKAKRSIFSPENYKQLMRIEKEERQTKFEKTILEESQKAANGIINSESRKKETQKLKAKKGRIKEVFKTALEEIKNCENVEDLLEKVFHILLMEREATGCQHLDLARRYIYNIKLAMSLEEGDDAKLAFAKKEADELITDKIELNIRIIDATLEIVAD